LVKSRWLSAVLDRVTTPFVVRLKTASRTAAALAAGLP
jgi:hypothetical protein